MLGGFPHELGASLFLETQHGLKTGDAPEIDLVAAGALNTLVLRQIREGRVLAAHDISEGGLLVTLSEMLFGEKAFGAEVDLDLRSGAERLDALLFGESQNRVVLAVPDDAVDVVVEDANDAGVAVDVIGRVTDTPFFNLKIRGNQVFGADTESLRTTWDNAIPEYMSQI